MNLKTATPKEVDAAIATLETEAFRQTQLIQQSYDTIHLAVRDRRKYHGRHLGWEMTDDNATALAKAKLDNAAEAATFFHYGKEDKAREALATIDAATAKYGSLFAEIERHEEEYQRRPWTRFHQLRSTTGARIHSRRYCQGLHRSDWNDLGWHPELSGKTVEEAVRDLGPVLCTKCFPKAKPEWRQDPKNLKPKDPDECPGTNREPVEGTVQGKATVTGYTEWGICPVCQYGKTVRRDGKLAKHKKPKVKK
uniref:hypothetical protein n=1 Tax=Nonomuraea sp. CA-251285 TaxID=3240002 RepID=UPI003F492358